MYSPGAKWAIGERFGAEPATELVEKLRGQTRVGQLAAAAEAEVVGFEAAVRVAENDRDGGAGGRLADGDRPAGGG